MWITVSCARAVLSGTKAMDDGRSMYTCPSLKLLTRSHTTLKCSGQEPTQLSRLKETGYLHKILGVKIYTFKDLTCQKMLKC